MKLLPHRIRMLMHCAVRIAGAMSVLVCLTLTSAPGHASAHARFVHGTPGPGDVLTTPPATIDAYFEEQIVKQSGTYGLAVFDSNSNEVDNQDTVLDDVDRHHMTVTLANGLAPGTYTVKWWTVSDDDGDAASDTYTFTIAGS